MAKHLINTAVHSVHFTLFFYKMLNEHAENVFPAAGDIRYTKQQSVFKFLHDLLTLTLTLDYIHAGNRKVHL